MLSRLRIAVRINLLLALAAFGMLGCAAIGLLALRAHMLEEKRVQLSYLMEMVLNDARGRMADAGGPQTEAGRAAFLETLRRAKFDGNISNYFYAYDYDGVAVLHPDKTREGKKRSDIFYPNGVKMVPQYVEAARSAPLGGFVEYEGWDGAAKPAPKLSYLRDVPELNVVVGVGVGIASINAAFFERLHSMAWMFASVMLATGLLGAIVSRSIREPLSNAVNKITRLAKGDLNIAPADTDEKSELGEVDKALDVLRANAIEQWVLQAKIHAQNDALLQQHMQSEERLRQFVEQAPVAITMLDRDMRHLACSRRWLAYYELKAEDVVGRSRYDVFPGMPERWKEAHRRAMAGESVSAEKDAFTRANGDTAWLRYEVQPWLMSDQSIGGVTIMVEDVTEKIAAVRSLRESKERQSFLLSLNDALRAIGDPVEAIAAASELLGRKLGANQVVYAEIDEAGSQAIVSRDWNDGSVPGAFAVYTLHEFDPSFIAALRNGQTVAVADVRSKDRAWTPAGAAFLERRLVSAFIVAPLLKDGKLLALLGVKSRTPHEWTKNEIALTQETAGRTWEAVERARVAQALRESEERLHFALEAAGVGTWEISPDTGEFKASDRTLALLNISPGTPVDAKTVFARVYSDDRPRVQAGLRRALETGEPFNAEWRMLLPDGSVRWLETRGERRFVAGKWIAGGVTQDVTERVNGLLQKVDEQTKSLVAEKEKAERAVKAKSDILSNMSHELRTPMHAILSFAKFGLKKCRTTDADTIEDYFKTIHDSGVRLLGLLNDILDLAKLESGKMTMARSSGDFLEVLDQTKNELGALLDERSITLKTEIFTNNTKSTFDKHRMIQVLVNLISNAVKFSPTGSQISLTVLDSRSPGGAEVLRCSVGDEGPGIPETELDAVFEKFIQSSNTKSGGGTGLGLPICREIVKAHGGHIWAENRKPNGALFSFVIPRRLDA